MTLRRVIWAMPYEESTSLTEPRAFAIADLLGPSGVLRPTFRWSECNPARNEFDFAPIRPTIVNARAANLLIMPTICWAPAWASGGKPAYEEYTRGCTRWKRNAGSIMDVEFDDSKDYCVNPPHIDRLASYEFGAEVGRFCGRSTWLYDIWNEPGGKLYWPPIYAEQFLGRPMSGMDDPDDAVHRLMSEVVVPMTAGIRSHDRKAQFAGPEADGADILRRCLEYERAHDHHVWDAISTHPYKLDNPSVYATIDQFEAVIAKERIDYDDDRPHFYSETGVGDQHAVLDFLEQVVNRDDRDVSLIGIQRSGLPEGGWWVEGSWEDDRPELNRYGLELKKWIAGQNNGRSARMHV